MSITYNPRAIVRNLQKGFMVYYAVYTHVEVGLTEPEPREPQ